MNPKKPDAQTPLKNQKRTDKTAMLQYWIILLLTVPYKAQEKLIPKDLSLSLGVAFYMSQANSCSICRHSGATAT